MEKVNQFLFGNEIELPFNNVKKGQLFFCFSDDKILVYRKTKASKKLVKTVNNYGELYEVNGINLEPKTPSFIILNP